MNLRHLIVVLSLITVGIGLISNPLRAENIDLRQPGALYLSDLPAGDPVELKVLRPTAVYATMNRQGFTRNFMTDEVVKLIAYHPEILLVQRLSDGREGWVAAEDLSEPPPERIQGLKDHLTEEAKFAKAIKDKRVLAGMTFDHVERIMGKPDETSFRYDAAGRTDMWTYIAYKTTFQDEPFRDPSTDLVHIRRVRVKVPASETIVEFLDGKVSALEKVNIR